LKPGLAPSRVVARSCGSPNKWPTRSGRHASDRRRRLAGQRRIRRDRGFLRIAVRPDCLGGVLRVARLCRGAESWGSAADAALGAAEPRRGVPRQSLGTRHQMVPCRADGTRKRYLAQRRKGAEKKRRRRKAHSEQRPMLFSSFAPLRLCASFFLSSFCVTLFVPRRNGFRHHFEAAPFVSAGGWSTT
jgi:hypothetical protein